MPRISQLPALTAPEANDEIAIVDASAATTKKITRADFLKGAALPADTVDTQAIEDSAVTPEKIGSASFIEATDANGWERSLRPDGRTEYTKSVGITTPSLVTGATQSVSVGNAPVGVNPNSAYHVGFAMTTGTGTTAQALVYRLGMANSSGGALVMIFTNPYASTTGGAAVTMKLIIVD